MSNVSSNNIVFKYRTEIGTGDTADQADFTAIAGEFGDMLHIGSTLHIVVPITDDASEEGDETFSLVLSDVSGAVFAGGGTNLIATGTITDNEVVDADGNGLIEISTYAELYNIRYNLAGTSYKTSLTDSGNSIGCPAQGCVGYELRTNISLGSSSWKPIQGQADTSIRSSDACVNDNSGVLDNTGCILPTAFFSAIFDGNGKTISNLTIRRRNNLLGLFGVVSGTIKNLKLRYGSITDSNNNPTTAGTLVSHLMGSGIIEASSSNLEVSVRGYYVGGLVGRSYGTIRNSYAFGDVTGGYGFCCRAGSGYVGGLVGYNGGTVQDSYATGAVTGGAGIWKDYVGGLVGLSDEK